MTAQYMLLGSSGQLGRAILNEFEAEGIEHLAKTHETLDLTDLPLVRDQIETLRPTLVINAAAYTDVMGSEREKQEAWKVNTLAVDNLVKVCCLNEVPLIHVSTSEVFGDLPGRTTRKETHPTAPRSWNAQTKACGEQAILGLSQSLCPEYRDYSFRYWIIRTSLVFERPFRASKNMLYQYTKHACGRSNGRLPAARDVYRSVSYAPHLAKALVWLATHHDQVVSGIYHVCNDGVMNLYDIFRTIGFKVSKAQVEPCSLEEMAKSFDFDPELVPRNSTLDCEKWHEMAPFRMPNIHDALEEFASQLA